MIQFVIIHGMYGKIIGLKVFYVSLGKKMLIKRLTHYYGNIVDVNGQYVDLGYKK